MIQLTKRPTKTLVIMLFSEVL